MNTINECQVSGFTTSDLKLKGFKVYETPGIVYPPLSYARRDIYKIVMATGAMTICYGDQIIDTNGTFLAFLNPHVPYSVHHHSIDSTGYACLFTPAFIESREWQESMQHSPHFRFGDTPVIPLN